MAIYLIRHGETALNAARVMQPPGTPLSERGLAQAARLAERLRSAGIRRVLASDLPRAAMTADALVATTGAPVEHDPLLQERNFGDLRGRPYTEFTFDPFAPDYVPPAGESWAAFEARVDRAFARIEEEVRALGGEGHLAVVTHGLVCRSIVVRKAEALDEGTPVPTAWPNTCLTILEGGGGPTPWRVALLACAAHLDELPEGRGAA